MTLSMVHVTVTTVTTRFYNQHSHVTLWSYSTLTDHILKSAHKTRITKYKRVIPRRAGMAYRTLMLFFILPQRNVMQLTANEKSRKFHTSQRLFGRTDGRTGGRRGFGVRPSHNRAERDCGLHSLCKGLWIKRTKYGNVLFLVTGLTPKFINKI